MPAPLCRSLLLVTLLCAAPIASAADTRVALLIGNARYTQVSTLSNPTRDVDLVGHRLKSMGYSSVRIVKDANLASLQSEIGAFARAAAGAETAVLYYAGHGLEIEGKNYLLPIDVSKQASSIQKSALLPLDEVLHTAMTASKMNLVILDACRDSGGLKIVDGASSASRGLARQTASGNVLVAYAAKHGQVALDGSGRNSPFATAFDAALAQPAQDVRMLFGQVRDWVLEASGGQQEPYIYGSLGSGVYTLSGSSAIASVVAPVTVDVPQLPLTPADPAPGADWLLNPRLAGGIATTGCVSSRGNLMAERNAALARARADLARQISMKIETLDRTQEDFQENDQSSQASFQFASVSQQASAVAVQGLRVLKVESVMMEGKKMTCAAVGVDGAGLRMSSTLLANMAAPNGDAGLGEAIKQRLEAR